MAREAVIVAGARTAVGRGKRGTLKNYRPEDLAAETVKAAWERAGDLDKALVDDIVMGCAFPEGSQGLNMARPVALHAGFPDSVPEVLDLHLGGVLVRDVEVRLALEEDVGLALGGGVGRVLRFHPLEVEHDIVARLPHHPHVHVGEVERRLDLVAAIVEVHCLAAVSVGLPTRDHAADGVELVVAIVVALAVATLSATLAVGSRGVDDGPARADQPRHCRRAKHTRRGRPCPADPQRQRARSSDRRAIQYRNRQVF